MYGSEPKQRKSTKAKFLLRFNLLLAFENVESSNVTFVIGGRMELNNKLADKISQSKTTTILIDFFSHIRSLFKNSNIDFL